MSFQKLLAFTKKISDLADDVVGNPSELKADFDAAPDEVRTYLNSLIDALQRTTDGDSGADSVKATPILTSPDSIQGILEWLSGGMIQESGSNENGSYIRFANGTQICYGRKAVFRDINIVYGSLYRCDSYSITHPVPFVTTSMIPTTTVTGKDCLVQTLGDATDTNFSVYAIKPVSVTFQSVTFNFVSIGKWK